MEAFLYVVAASAVWLAAGLATLLLSRCWTEGRDSQTVEGCVVLLWPLFLVILLLLMLAGAVGRLADRVLP